MTVEDLVNGMMKIPRTENRFEIMQNFYADMYQRNTEPQLQTDILSAIAYRHHVDKVFCKYMEMKYCGKEKNNANR